MENLKFLLALTRLIMLPFILLATNDVTVWITNLNMSIRYYSGVILQFWLLNQAPLILVNNLDRRLRPVRYH